MNILDVIRDDHDEALALIESLLERADTDGDVRVPGLARELAIALRLHARAEEAILYPILTQETRGAGLEGYNEHELIDIQCEKVLLLEPGPDGELRAAAKVLRELVSHHGKQEEEGILFPKLAKIFERDELEALGRALLGEKERRRAEVEALVDDEAAGTATIHDLRSDGALPPEHHLR